MSEETVMEPTAVGETPAAEKKAPVLANIIRGRMPVGIVYIVRFNHKDEKVSDLAKAFGTTTGKIVDVLQNNNFGYVKEDFKPTAAQVAESVAWIQRHPDFEKGAADTIILELEGLTLAGDTEAAAFLAARVAARGTSVTTKTGEIADGGGGNNIKGNAKKNQKKAKEEVAGGVASAEELLA
jgi:hypothetical protein